MTRTNPDASAPGYLRPETRIWCAFSAARFSRFGEALVPTERARAYRARHSQTTTLSSILQISVIAKSYIEHEPFASLDPPNVEDFSSGFPPSRLLEIVMVWTVESMQTTTWFGKYS